MSEYVKLKTARGIVCSACEEFALPGGCPEDCAWMRRLKENAADVAPVVHGQWLDNEDYMFCSICGIQWNYCDNDTKTFNYCPNCGARMDGDAHASD